LQIRNSERTGISYAWVILGVIFIGMVATFGMTASFGAYISPWEQDFSVGRTVVTSIPVLSFIVLAIAQPMIGKLNDHFGKSVVPSVGIIVTGASLFLTSQANQLWQIFLLFGVMFPLGVTCSGNIVAVTAISNWFIEKRGLALGLATSGLAVGQLVLVPVNLLIIERLGWRSAMAILSIALLIIVGPLFIFLLRCRPEEKGLKPFGYKTSGDDDQKSDIASPETKKVLPIISIFKLRAFILISVSSIICGFTDVGLITTHLIPMAQGKGFSVSIVAVAFSLIAVANIAGTIVTGHLSDHFSRKKQLTVIFGVRALTYIFLLLIQRPGLLPIFAIVYGAVEMASIAPVNSLTVELFDKYSIGAVLGVVGVSHQIGGAIGSWAPGLLFDMTGSYSIALTFSIFILFAAAVMVLWIPEPVRDKAGGKKE